jgi:hypothetical protein
MLIISAKFSPMTACDTYKKIPMPPIGVNSVEVVSMPSIGMQPKWIVALNHLNV